MDILSHQELQEMREQRLKEMDDLSFIRYMVVEAVVTQQLICLKRLTNGLIGVDIILTIIIAVVILHS